jgi:hypothetical protein
MNNLVNDEEYSTRVGGGGIGESWQGTLNENAMLLYEVESRISSLDPKQLVGVLNQSKLISKELLVIGNT